MQGSCADLKTNAIGHSGRSWAKGGGERQTVVIVHQGNDCPAQRFFAHIPVRHMRQFMIGDVSGFRHRGERQVEAMGKPRRKERHIHARIARFGGLSLIEVSEMTPESNPIVYLD